LKIETLKKIRLDKGLTQAQLSERTDIAIRSYQYYERGERVPDVITAQRIAKVLNKDVREIFPLPE